VAFSLVFSILFVVASEQLRHPEAIGRNACTCRRFFSLCFLYSLTCRPLRWKKRLFSKATCYQRFVRLHPADDGKGLPREVLSTHPKDYVPKRAGRRLLRASVTGPCPIPDDFVGCTMRRLDAQYWYCGDDMPNPEEQVSGTLSGTAGDQAVCWKTPESVT
jgi:hypothetical protein